MRLRLTNVTIPQAHHQHLHRLQLVASTIAINVGLLALLGWAADIPALVRLSPDLPPLLPLSALGLILAGLGLGARGAASRAIGATLLLAGLGLGLARALAAHGGHDLGPLGGLPTSSVMLNMVLGGIALLLRDAPGRQGALYAQLFALLVLLNAMRALVGFVTVDVIPLLIPSQTGMALHGAICVLLLGLGLLLDRPDSGFMALVVSPSAAGRLLRWLFTAGFALPMLLVLVAEFAWRSGLFGTGVGLVLLVTGNMWIFYRAAAAYDRADRARRAAEEHLARANADLERRVAERTAALAEREAQISAIGDNLPGVMIYQAVADKGGAFRFTYLSAGIERISGLTAEATIEEPELLYGQITPETRERLAAIEAEAARSHGGIDAEVQKQTPFGPRWSRIRARPRHLGDGRIVWDGIEVDITDTKRVEAERLSFERKLLETQRMESLGVLAGGVAHDFNNILAAIVGHAELARLDVAPGGEAALSLDAIILGARRAADLTAQMLAYAGRGRLITEVVDLNQAARELSELTRATLPRGVSLRLGLAPYLAPVAADGTQVRQVLLNLLTNAGEAIVATGEEGAIVIATGRCVLTPELLAEATVSAASPGPHGFVEVGDTGDGIDPETMGRIFDPFFSTKFTGRGLGLAAVQGIIRAHRGALFVRSAPGRGATFRACFPLAPSGEGSAGKPTSPR